MEEKPWAEIAELEDWQVQNTEDIFPTEPPPGGTVGGLPSDYTYCPDHDACFQAFMQMLPPGTAFDNVEYNFNRDSTIRQFVSGLGLFWMHFEDAMCITLDEWFCSTAKLDLDTWNKDYGIPDECDLFNQSICAKVQVGNQATPEYLMGLLEASGFVGEGRWLTGDDPEFPGVRSTFYFMIDKSLSSAFALESKLSFKLGMGFKLGSAEIENLYCMLERYVPAHCVVNVEESGAFHPNLLGAKLKAWWNADTTANGIIPGWLDTVSSQNALSTGSARPRSGLLSGYKAVGFDGSDDYLRTGNLTVLPSGDNVSETFALFALGDMIPPPPPVGAGLLVVTEGDAWAADFLHTVDAERIVLKAGTYPEYYGSSFIANLSTSPKWIYNSVGTLYLSPAGSKHLDYDPITHAPKGLLNEPPSTNRAYQSAMGRPGFLWSGNGATHSTSPEMDPTGGFEALQVVVTPGSGPGAGLNVTQYINPLVVGTVYTGSMWVKGIPGQQIFFNSNSNLASSQVLVTFTGAWQRVFSSFTATDTSGAYLACECDDRGTGPSLPAITFHCWGAQFEEQFAEGGAPTSYIPTTTAYATRNGDVYRITPASINNNPAAGTWWIELELLSVQRTARIIGFDSGSTPIYQNNPTTFGLFDISGGAETISVPSTLGINKIATAYQSADKAIVADGLPAVSDTAGSTGLLAPGVGINLGSYGGAGSDWVHGYIRRTTYRPRRVANGQMQTETSLTTPISNILPPVISGAPNVGNTLIASNGYWIGYPVPTYTYQWNSNTVPISGATNNTYVLQASDETAIITVTVTATNVTESVSATSVNSKPITQPIGAAKLLFGRKAGWAGDFLHPVDAERVALKTSTALALFDLSFFTNLSTSPKRVYDVNGVLGWSPHNLFANSEDLSALNVEYGTATLNNQPGPNDLLTADTFTEDTTSGVHNCYGSRGFANTDHTISRDYKMGTRRYATIGWSDGTNGAYAVYDLQSGIVGSSAAIGAGVLNSASMQALPNGWYRCILSAKVNSPSIIYTFGAANAATITPDGYGRQVFLGTGATLFFGRAQINQGILLTAYIPTPTSAASYGLALDHDPITHDPKGLKVEPTATNLHPRSQELNAGYWFTVNATVGANAIAAPDSSMTADAFIPASSSGQPTFGNNYNPVVVSGQVYTYSMYAKNGSLGSNWLQLAPDSGGTTRCWFDLANGVKGSNVYASPAIDYTIKAVGNGWYRLTVTFRANSTTFLSYNFTCTSDANMGSMIGDGVKPACYIWGVQLEAGSKATSYIMTTDAEATRALDQYTVSPNAIYHSNTAGTWWAKTLMDHDPGIGRIIG